MNAYANDDRVQPHGDGFAVTVDGYDTCYVLPTEVFGWTICHGPKLEYVWSEAGPAIGFASVDVAIHALIGDPQ